MCVADKDEKQLVRKSRSPKYEIINKFLFIDLPLEIKSNMKYKNSVKLRSIIPLFRVTRVFALFSVKFFLLSDFPQINLFAVSALNFFVNIGFILQVFQNFLVILRL